MRSMTGVGSGTYSDGKLSVCVEIKSVNQRFLELNVRMPHAYMVLEDKLRQAVKKVIHRGKVDIYVTVAEQGLRPQSFCIDYEALEACKTALDVAKARFFGEKEATLSEIMTLTTDWFTPDPPLIDEE